MPGPDLLPITACPSCGSAQLDRLWVASWRADACRCRSCGRSWDGSEAGRD